MTLFTDVSILLMCFVLFSFLSEHLVSSLTHFSKKLNISMFIIGSVILSLGTSAPELIGAIFSSIIGVGELALGGLIGSNITNICLVLGVTAIIHPISPFYSTELDDSLFLTFINLLFLLFILDSFISRYEGAALILLYVLYHLYSYKDVNAEKEIYISSINADLLLTPVSVVGLVICGFLAISSSIRISEQLNISFVGFGLTVLALGSSLPELFSSAVSALKKKSKLAVGNVMGSNIANFLLVLGVLALINPLSVKITSIIVLSLFLLFIAVLLLTFFIWNDKSLTKGEGIALLITYLMYLLIISLMT